MDKKQSDVLHFKFMRIVILLFRQFNFVVTNDCECEVQPWNDWSGPDSTCGSAIEGRQRVCSTISGWKLGLGCNEEGYMRNEYRSKMLAPCRKLFFKFKINLRFWLAGILTWEKDQTSSCQNRTHGYESNSFVCKGKDLMERKCP